MQTANVENSYANEGQNAPGKQKIVLKIISNVLRKIKNLFGFAV